MRRVRGVIEGEEAGVEALFGGEPVSKSGRSQLCFAHVPEGWLTDTEGVSQSQVFHGCSEGFLFVFFIFTGLGVCGFTEEKAQLQLLLHLVRSSRRRCRENACVCVRREGTRISREKLMFTPQVNDRWGSLSLTFYTLRIFPPRQFFFANAFIDSLC